jgi:catalase
LKFYTDEGNYDLVGNNTPVFFIRDASQFSDFIHSQKRLPDTGLRSNDMQWDFWTLTPESAHQVAILMSDRGTPRTLRHMHGFSSHTYSWMNAKGERFWVKYHFKTVQGIESFTLAEADAMVSQDPDFHRRDLWDAIAAGNAPEWRLEMQIMPFEDAAGYRFNPFDLTKVWPHADHPPITIGRMVLDRRHHLVTNIVAHASADVSAGVQERVIDCWTNVDAELGAHVAAGLGYGEAAQAA